MMSFFSFMLHIRSWSLSPVESMISVISQFNM
jgi:hypothetical protein